MGEWPDDDGSGGRLEELPPHDRAAEQIVLGGMMISPDAVNDVSAILDGSQDFYVPAHQIVYEAILVLTGKPGDDGRPPAHDPVAVADYLAGTRQIGKIGGATYLHSLMAAVPAAVNAGYYAQIVRERSIERKMLAAATRIIQATRAHGIDLPDKVDAAYTVLDEASGLVAPAQARPMAELLPPALDRIEAGPDLRRVLTGWSDLDQLLGGMRPGQFLVVGARPSAGKTVVLLNAAVSAAIQQRVPVLLGSLEMSAQECIERILAARAGVALGRIRDGELTEADWDRLSRAVADVADAPLHINSDPYLRVQGLRSDLRAMRRAGTPAGLVVIDYLQLMTAAGRQDSRQAEVAQISRSLKLLGKEFDVPVLVAAQLNRGPELRGDHRPLLADLRDSGSVEQDADVVILLYRDEMYEETSAYAGQIDLIVAKHRSGPTGTVTMAFRGHEARIAGMAWTPSAAAVPDPDAWIDPQAAKAAQEDELARFRERQRQRDKKDLW